ncbi:MAG: hypothetical protein ABII18_10295 [bacterium]|nr:hypothetical protein [bacterium]MBU1918112.1 hypothetical protein [bacterium]
MNQTIYLKQLIIAIVLIFLSFSVQAGERHYSFGLSAAFENYHFLVNRTQHANNDIYAINLEAQFLYDNHHNFKIDLKPWVLIDIDPVIISRYIPNEANVLYYSSWLEISAGMQYYNKGISEFYNPTKVFTRYDFEDKMYMPGDVGELIFRAKILKTHIGPFDDFSVEFIVQPWFQQSYLSENDSRFALAGDFGSVPYELDDVHDNPQTYFDSIGWGVVLKGMLSSLEWEILYYHGPERTPAYYFTTNSGGALRLRPFYYVIDMVGANLSYSVGRFLLKAELAGKITLANDAITHDLPNQTDNLVPDSYFQFVVGADYTVENLFKEHILRLTVEYYGEDDDARELAEYRPLKNDIFLGADYDFNNRLMTHLRLGVLKDLGNTELAIILETETKIYRELKWEVQAAIVNRDSDPTAPLSYFDNNSYLLTRLSYSFGS